MEAINEERPEVQSWIERMARQMKAQRFDGRDLNEVLAWVLGALLAKILPGAWGGAVPPITLEGRHTAIDDYLERNPWRALVSGDRFLDLGCGFPPLTTMDSAKRFPGVQLTGADPSFAVTSSRTPMAITPALVPTPSRSTFRVDPTRRSVGTQSSPTPKPHAIASGLRVS